MADGWLEPLVARIHEDRTRVVVPNIRGFDLDTLDLTPNPPWPPTRGFFNWRLSFTIIMADVDEDMLEPGDKRSSAVKSPVWSLLVTFFFRKHTLMADLFFPPSSPYFLPGHARRAVCHGSTTVFRVWCL